MPLFIASPASFFISVLPLPVTTIGFLRLPPVIGSLFLHLLPWRLLLTLCRPWLLPVTLGCRTPLLWLRALAVLTALRGWR